MADYAAQRENMVEAQVRANDVTDPRIHAALRRVPRERFVPAPRRPFAYAETCVEVWPKRFLLDPRTFAKLVQLAEIRPDDIVLDVGCATGYSAAVLAQLATTVVALEEDAELVRAAGEAVAAVGADNAVVVQGRLCDGLPEQGPFDVVFVNGAVETEPGRLLAQLKDGGRLVAVLKHGAQGRAWRFVRHGDHIGRRPAFDANVPVLPGFRAAVGFVF